MEIFVRAHAACMLLALATGLLAAEHREPARRKPGRRPGREAQMMQRLARAETHIYKTVGDVKLRLFIFRPEGHKPADKRPAIVFFFGGGWIAGSPAQFAPQCRYLASRGMVAITAEYRVRSRHGASVPECVADAKSAIRWVRAHASELGIDPDRIAAGGGSAGGHLAACTGVVPGLDEADEDMSSSSRPNAMVLFNPVMATAPVEALSAGYKRAIERLKDRLGGDPQAVSPYHHIQRNQPPMIMFFGSADRLLESARLFEKAYRTAHNRCELKIWDGPGHGFFNYGRSGNKYFVETCREMDRFLASLGYLEGAPTVESFVKERAGDVQR